MALLDRAWAWVIQHPITSTAVVLAGLGVGAYLVFGVFGFHLVFVDEVVAEADPFAVDTDASGTASDQPLAETGGAATEILTDGDRRVLRLEDFRTDNGPDLNVYLVAAPPDAEAAELGADFIDLGDLKGNVGDQNYEIPRDVDLDRYSTVVIWCVRFATAFGAAGLA